MTTTTTKVTTQLPTDSAILRALRASIERFGVLVPIVYDQHGEMIDGHHRKMIADELDLRFIPEVTLTLPDDPDERAQAIIDINDARRQKLTAEQRQDIAKALREQGHSTRAIAAVVGASKSAIDRDLRQLSHVGQLAEPAAVTGLDGRTRQAKPKLKLAPEPKPAPKPKPKPKARPKPASAPEPEPQAATSRYWPRLSEGVRDIRAMRDEATKMLQTLSPEDVWRLADPSPQPGQVGADVLIELDKAALQLSFTVSYQVGHLLRPDQPESWGPNPNPDLGQGER